LENTLLKFNTSNKNVTIGTIADNFDQKANDIATQQRGRYITPNSSNFNADGSIKLGVTNNESTGRSGEDHGSVVTMESTSQIATPSNGLNSQQTRMISSVRDMSETVDRCERQMDEIINKMQKLIDQGKDVPQNAVSAISTLADKVTQLKNAINDFRNIGVSSKVQEIVQTVNNATQKIKDDINSVDVNAIITALNEGLEKSKASEFVEKFLTQMEDVSHLIDVVSQSCKPEEVKNLINILEQYVGTIQQTAKTAENLSESTINVADSVDKTTEVLASQTKQLDTANEIAEQNKELIDLLTLQYKEVFKNYGITEKVAKDFFEKLSGYTTANTSSAISEIIKAVKDNNIENLQNLLNPDNQASLLNASKQITELIGNLNNEDVGDLGLDDLIPLISEMDRFAKTAIVNQENMKNTFKVLGERAGTDDFRNAIHYLEEEVENLKSTADDVKNIFQGKLSSLIEESNRKLVENIARANQPGTEQYNKSNIALAQGFYEKGGQAISSEQNLLQDAMMHFTAGSLKADRNALPMFYRSVAGNFLGNRGQFQNQMQDAFRASSVSASELSKSLQYLPIYKEAGDVEAARAQIGFLDTAATNSAQAHLAGLNNINLKRGQYKLLDEDDKQMLDSFLKSSDAALESLRAAIAAISQFDPKDKSLEHLRSLEAELSKTAEKIKDIKDDGFDLGDMVKSAVSGLSSVHGAFVSGMGMMGLGMLAPTLSNLTKIGSNAFNQYRNMGKSRYELARADFAMGADLNRGQASYMINNMADEYFKASGGQIGLDQVKNFNLALRRGVGGHYGSSPTDAQNDMFRITESTFAIAQQYQLSDNDVASFMKNTYKDMGMAADEASYMMVRMAQTAQQAGIPVSNYINAMSNLIGGLREYGLTAEEVEGAMKAMVSKGVRQEDASRLLSDTAHAARGMGFNDPGASAFYAMMSGQGNDIFGNIVSGRQMVDSNGKPMEGYYPMMAQRLFAETGLMGMIGGGPGSQLGAWLVSEQLSKRGYSPTSVSMLTDAYLNNDMERFADLLKKADEEKEGIEQRLTDATREATEKIRASGSQLSAVTQAQAAVAMAEKHLGEVIEKDLDKPLKSLVDTFGKGLNTVVGAVEHVIEAFTKFAGTETGQALGNLATTNFPGLLAGGALAYTAGRGALNVATDFAKYGITRDPKALGTGAKFIKNMSRGKKLALGAAAVAGGAYLASNIGDVISSLQSTFSSGDVKVQIENGKGGTGAMPKFEQIAPSEAGDSEEERMARSIEEANQRIQEAATRLDTVSPESQVSVNNLDRAAIEKRLSQQFSSQTSNAPLGDMVSAGGGFLGGIIGMAKSGSLSAPMSTLGTFAKGNALANFIGAGFNEIGGYMNNPDQFTLGERFGRFLISGGSATAGSVLGGAIGSLGGPLGTMAGMAIGGFLGDKAGDYLKDAFGIGDNDGQKMGEDYLDASKWASDKYTDDTNSLINSNDNRARAAEEQLKKHGTTMTKLTQDQQQYMDQIFKELKTRGYGDLTAAIVAGDIVGEQKQQLTQQTLDNPELLKEAINRGLSQSGLNNAQFKGKYQTARDYYEDGKDKASQNLAGEFADILNDESLSDMEYYTGTNTGKLKDNQKIYDKIYELVSDNAKYRLSGDTDKLAKDITDKLIDEFKNKQTGGTVSANLHSDLSTLLAPHTETTAKEIGKHAAENYPKKITINDKEVKDNVDNAEKTNENMTGIKKLPLFSGIASAELLSGVNKEAGIMGNTYSVDAGTKISTIGAGNVLKAYQDEKLGGVVEVNHGNNIIAKYGNLGDVSGFAEGAAIKAGEYIGDTVGDQMYFEMTKNGQIVENPDLNNYAINGIPAASNIASQTQQQSNQNQTPEERIKSLADPSKALQTATDQVRTQQKNLLEFANRNGWDNRIATGRMMLTGLTASGRERERFMTPQGVLDDFYLNSGVTDKDLYGFNQQGFFSYDEKTGQMVQYHSSGREMIEKMEKKFRDENGYTGKTTWFNEAAMEATDRAAQSAENAYSSSAGRYDTSDAERAEEDWKKQNDIDSKNNVNVNLNVIGGGVSKAYVINAMTYAMSKVHENVYGNYVRNSEESHQIMEEAVAPQ